MLEALDAALAAKDADGFRRTAHSLKSNSLTFGANRLADLAREQEHGANAAVESGQRAPLDALAAEYARVSAALTRLRHA